MAEAGSIVGAVIGFAITGGSPTGMYIGSMVGGAIGSHVAGPTRVPAPDLNEAPVQTSREGIAIPIVWGQTHLHGNIIAKVPEVEWSTYRRVGKSLFSSGTKIETKHRSRTFAIGLCRSAVGPIAGVSRIWEDEKLVYDSRDAPDISTDETDDYAAGITIYLGDEAQLPDPDLEAHYGVGTTPAFRGLAYIVWVDKELTDTGGRIPNYRFEVNAFDDLSVSSKPYPIDVTDGLGLTVAPTDGYVQIPPTDGLALTVTPQDSDIGVVVASHTLPAEGTDHTVTPQNGTIASKVQDYTVPPEGLDQTVTPQDGDIAVRLVSYDIQPEGLDLTVTPQDGTLT